MGAGCPADRACIVVCSCDGVFVVFEQFNRAPKFLASVISIVMFVTMLVYFDGLACTRRRDVERKQFVLSAIRSPTN
jgi:hypothetical protein